mgnify:CR=1 FL=1
MKKSLFTIEQTTFFVLLLVFWSIAAWRVANNEGDLGYTKEYELGDFEPSFFYLLNFIDIIICQYFNYDGKRILLRGALFCLYGLSS